MYWTSYHSLEGDGWGQTHSSSKFTSIFSERFLAQFWKSSLDINSYLLSVALFSPFHPFWSRRQISIILNNSKNKSNTSDAFHKNQRLHTLSITLQKINYFECSSKLQWVSGKSNRWFHTLRNRCECYLEIYLNVLISAIGLGSLI